LDFGSLLKKKENISGISVNNFTPADFLAQFSTSGKKKRQWGNPYELDIFIKGEGKQTQMLTKARGKLVISLDIDKDEACYLKSLIDAAGVSAFSLGKKGLAYVSSISV
jgi:hypothetical protein